MRFEFDGSQTSNVPSPATFSPRITRGQDRPNWDSTFSNACCIRARLASIEKSTGGSLTKVALVFMASVSSLLKPRSAVVCVNPISLTSCVAPVGVVNKCSTETPCLTPARRNESFDVFSSKRLTRYAIPGINSP